MESPASSHGLYSVLETVLERFDKGEISLDAAREIIKDAREEVHEDYKAVNALFDCRCPRCLKKVDNKDQLYCTIPSMDRLSYLLWGYRLPRAGQDIPWPSCCYCADCFDSVFSIFKDPEAGKRERRLIDRDRRIRASLLNYPFYP